MPQSFGGSIAPCSPSQQCHLDGALEREKSVLVSSTGCLKFHKSLAAALGKRQCSVFLRTHYTTVFCPGFGEWGSGICCITECGLFQGMVYMI